MNNKFENENKEEKLCEKNTSSEDWTKSLFLSLYQKPCIHFHI